MFNNKSVKSILLVFVGSFTLAFIFYIYIIYKIKDQYYSDYEEYSEVQLRKFPYPYKAALTICNDADATTSADEFLTIQKYLNFHGHTDLGNGLGIEIGNSVFMYDRENNFSYFSDRPKDSEIIAKYIDMGLVDGLHSFGEKENFKRSDAQKAISELKKLNRKVDVWSDHANTIDNINGDQMGGEGDLKTSSAYHIDLLVDYGFKFFWLGRVTSKIATETAPSPGDFLYIIDTKHLVTTIKTSLKELMKHILGILGNVKYAMHKDYRLVQIKTLRDGQKV